MKAFLCYSFLCVHREYAYNSILSLIMFCRSYVYQPIAPDWQLLPLLVHFSISLCIQRSQGQGVFRTFVPTIESTYNFIFTTKEIKGSLYIFSVFFAKTWCILPTRIAPIEFFLLIFFHVEKLYQFNPPSLPHLPAPLPFLF